MTDLEEAMEIVVEHCKENEAFRRTKQGDTFYCTLLHAKEILGECSYLDKSGCMFTRQDKEDWQSYKIYKCTYKEKHPCSECTCKANK